MLLIPCVERCGLTIAVKLPLTHEALERVSGAKDWILSVMTPPETPVAVGALCAECAKRIYSPDVLAEMQRRRDARLS